MWITHGSLVHVKSNLKSNSLPLFTLSPERWTGGPLLWAAVRSECLTETTALALNKCFMSSLQLQQQWPHPRHHTQTGLCLWQTPMAALRLRFQVVAVFPRGFNYITSRSHIRGGEMDKKMMEKGGWRDWVREPDQPRVTVTASAFLISRSAPKQSHFFGDTLKALLQRCARSSGATNWPETEPFPHTGRPLLCNVRKPFLARSGKTSSFQSESACVQNS